MLAALESKLIGGLIVLLIIAGLTADRGRWMHRAHGDEAQLQTICAAVRVAAGNPKLDCKLVSQQIGELGTSLKAVTDALNDQNGRVEEMGRENAALQAQKTPAQRVAAKRAEQATGVAVHLEESAGTPPAQPCPVSKALEEQWK
jgi:hypothetical protein